MYSEKKNAQEFKEFIPNKEDYRKMVKEDKKAKKKKKREESDERTDKEGKNGRKILHTDSKKDGNDNSEIMAFQEEENRLKQMAKTIYQKEYRQKEEMEGKKDGTPT